MTIRTRLLIYSAILVILFLVLAGVNWIGNTSVQNESNNSYLFKDSLMHLQRIFRGINEFIIDEGEPLSVELIKEHIQGFEDALNELSSSLHDPEISTMLMKKVKPQWEIVRNSTTAFVENNPWISPDDDKAMLEYGQLISEEEKLYDSANSLAEKSLDLANSNSIYIKKLVNVIAAVILCIIFLILLNIFRSIYIPLKELQHTARRFRHGDFSEYIETSRTDEFGNLSNDFNGATEKINEILSEIQEVTDILTANSEKISSSAVHIATNAGEQSSQTERVVMALEELNGSFSNVVENTIQTARSARDAEEMSYQSVDIITDTVNGMHKIAESVNESAENISALDSSSRQISEIIKVIDDIASQTDLLALNAAIEAARAGEHGRGFAVVADEVKKLAEKTTNSTKEIGNMISIMKQNISRAVDSLSHWQKEVTENLSLANRIGNALQMTVVALNNVTHMSQQIAAAVDEQARTGKIINDDIDTIAKLARQTADDAQKSSTATIELNALTRQLQHIVSEFKLKEQSLQADTLNMSVEKTEDKQASSL